MSVTVRKLQPSEWDLLPHEEGELLPDSERSIAIVALDEDGDSHARIFLVSPVHLEGIFIEHKWRSKLLMKRLFDAAEDEARAMGLTKLLAFGVTEEITDYVQRLGYEKQPWSVLVKELI